MELTPALVLAAAMLVIAALNLAFGRGDKGGARIAMLEAKQIADNAARQQEITKLGHKMDIAAVEARSAQQMSHRDNSEMKAKLDRVENLLMPIIDRLGLHVPVVSDHVR